MSEAQPVGTKEGAPTTAGGLLRDARQARGLHIAALASAIKVAPRKLELLEADRLDELPDATYTRALAQTVCRSLKIDAAPVLELLPRGAGHRLEQVAEGLNAPFMDRPGRLDTGGTSPARPAVWALGLVFLVTALIYVAPPGWLPLTTVRNLFVRGPAAGLKDPSLPGAVTSDPAAEAAAGAASAARATAAAPTQAAGPGAWTSAAAPTPSPAGTVTEIVPLPLSGGVGPAGAASDLASLHLQTSADSWIEVVDGGGQPLLARLVKGGERVELAGAPPLRLRIGNAAATEVVYRGEALALAPYTQNNRARLELK